VLRYKAGGLAVIGEVVSARGMVMGPSGPRKFLQGGGERLYHTSHAKKERAAASGEREYGGSAAGVFGGGEQTVAGSWGLAVIAQEFLRSGTLYSL
jgi:hypothetical protein